MPDSMRARIVQHRDAIRQLCAKHNVERIRLFGSVLRGNEKPGSDIDFLVQFRADSKSFDEMHLEQELTDLLGIKADVVTEDGIHWTIRDRVMADARPLDDLDREPLRTASGPAKDERLYLYVILDHACSVEEYSKTGRETLFGNELTTDALIWCIQKIGLTVESWSRMNPSPCPGSIRERLISTAHAVIEQYWDIDQDILWRVASEDVPALKTIVVEKLVGLGENPLASLAIHGRRAASRQAFVVQERNL